MTRKPETAPPWKAAVSAAPRFLRAPAAVRRFERTATFMPMKPETPDKAAPTRKEKKVRSACLPGC